ncbi:MAG: InlB B-repeat-containing protein [Candidatus Natronoplasma sp.]
MEKNEEVTENHPAPSSNAIYDWHDLNDVRNDLSGDHLLMNDLDENTTGYMDYNDPSTPGWDPIGDKGNDFTGTFDGQDHIIKDLYIDREGEDDVALFGSINGAEIKNLGVEDIYVKGGGGSDYSYGYTGGLVGNVFGNSIIERTYTTGEVVGTEHVVGGLVGRLNEPGPMILRSYSTATVDSSYSAIGGLAGQFETDTKVEDCFATGNVSAGEAAGGLVGQIWETEIVNSYSTGTVSGEQDRIGGLVGEDYGGTVANSFWDTESSGISESDGGTGKTTAEMKDVATFTDLSTQGLDEPWDFVGDPNDDTGNEDIWDIDNNEVINNGYPFFDWKMRELTISSTSGGEVTGPGEGTYRYYHGTEVDLLAEADNGWGFDKWTGDIGKIDDPSLADTSIPMEDDYTITAEFKEYGVEVTAPADHIETSWGTYYYDFQVENTGELNDTYDIQVTETEGWTVSVQDDVSADVGEIRSVEVTVEIPDDAGGVTSTVTLEATSQKDTSVSDDGSMGVTLEEDIGVEVTAPQDRTESSSGTYYYSFEVENPGNTEETYDLIADADKDGWSASSQRSDVTLPAGGVESVDVEVLIPDDAGGESCAVELEAASQTNTSVTDADFMTVTADHTPEVNMEAPPDQTENNSGNFSYSYDVENPSGFQDTYSIVVDADQGGWSASAQRSNITVGPGTTGKVDVTVTIPEGAGGESSDITLEATSQTDGTVTGSDFTTVTLEEQLGVVVEAPGNQSETGPGTYTYRYDVENTGNAEGTYDLTAFASRTGWSASSQQSSITLLPGEVGEVNVEVTIPEDVDDGETCEVILSAESQSDLDVSASDSMIVTYTEEEIREVSVSAPPDAVEDEPNNYTYLFEVHNTGTVDDVYDLSVDAVDWEVSIPEEISVNEGEVEEVAVEVTIPDEAEDGEDIEVNLTAVSQADDTVFNSDSMIVTFSEEVIEYELVLQAEEGGTTDPEPGTHTYQEGEEVTVEAIPDEGWYFTGWTGDHEGGEREVTLTMDSDKELSAHFDEIGENQYLLTISVEGEGTTEPEPGSHVCGEGEEVTVEAFADEGWDFVRWAGDRQSEEKEITVEMLDNYTITAEFAPESRTLTLSSTEGGEVVEPGEGAFEYRYGTEMTLEAEADEGYRFLRWRGDNETVGDVSANETTMIIEGNHSITAEFTELETWVEIESPEEAGIYNVSEIELEWDSEDADHHEVRLNDGDWIDVGTDKSFRFEDVDDGEHTIEVRAVHMEYSVVDEVNMTVDTVEPELEMIYPEDGEEITGSNATIEWEVSDEISGIDYCEIKIDDAWIKVEENTSYELNGLEPGEYSIDVRTFDRAGNSVEEKVDFAVESGRTDDESSSILGGVSIFWWVLLLVVLIFVPILLLFITRKRGEQEEKISAYTQLQDIEGRTSEGDVKTEEDRSSWVSKEMKDLSESQEEVEVATAVGRSESEEVTEEKEKEISEVESAGETKDIQAGAPLVGEGKEEDKKICPDCGSELSEDEVICPDCEHIFEEDEGGEELTLEDEPFTECQECGFLITDEEDECPYCETPLESEEEGTEDSEVKRSSVKPSDEKKCPECGEILSEEQEVCHGCGYIFEEEDL